MNFFQKMSAGLAKTRQALSSGFQQFFSGKKVDDATWEHLSDLLIATDMGANVTARLIATLKASIKTKDDADLSVIKQRLKMEIIQILKKGSNEKAKVSSQSSPYIRLFVGVNGAGKTTTIGKLAVQLRQAGSAVLLAAGDTFRAGAIEQLSVWAKRSGAEMIAYPHGADPSSVAFDAVSAAIARKVDHLLIDTAGRLQTHHNLMEEIKKVNRVIGKKCPSAPHERILVLDAMTGQNGLSQARLFHEAVGLTGIILTKLDTTAKGGVLVSIVESLSVPILYVGVGEDANDLLPFEIESYVEALFEGR
ncbi:MAG: signal recognition particle-docking protein FtsY [Nitrospirota bacterium]